MFNTRKEQCSFSFTLTKQIILLLLLLSLRLLVTSFFFIYANKNISWYIQAKNNVVYILYKQTNKTKSIGLLVSVGKYLFVSIQFFEKVGQQGSNSLYYYFITVHEVQHALCWFVLTKTT